MENGMEVLDGQSKTDGLARPNIVFSLVLGEIKSEWFAQLLNELTTKFMERSAGRPVISVSSPNIQLIGQQDDKPLFMATMAGMVWEVGGVEQEPPTVQQTLEDLPTEIQTVIEQAATNEGSVQFIDKTQPDSPRTSEPEVQKTESGRFGNFSQIIK